METIYQGIRSRSADDPFMSAKLCAMVTAYDAAWQGTWSKMELVAVEQELFAQCVNLDTGRKSRKYILKGYVDKFINLKGVGRVLIDHKTSSEDISDPNGIYWRRMDCDVQSTMYKELFLANGIVIDKIVWDVVKKPLIRPRKLTKEELKTLEADGTYMGLNITDSPGETESPQCFFARTLDWCITNSSNVFVRRDVVRSDQDVYQLNQNIWQQTRLLDFCDTKKCWPMSPGACFNYGRLCEYSDVCHLGADIQGGAYCTDDRASSTPKGWTGLSHSSLATFTACPRKYQYRYVDRRVPARAVDDENLVFGSAWHAALDDLFTLRLGGVGHE